MAKRIEVITLMSSDEETSVEVERSRLLRKKAREKEKRIVPAKVNNQNRVVSSFQKANINPSIPLNIADRFTLVNKSNHSNLINKPLFSNQPIVSKLSENTRKITNSSQYVKSVNLQYKSQASKNVSLNNMSQSEKRRNNVHRESYSNNFLGRNSNFNKNDFAQATGSQARFKNNNNSKHDLNSDLLKIDSLKNKLQKIGVSVQSVAKSSTNKITLSTNSSVFNSQISTTNRQSTSQASQNIRGLYKNQSLLTKNSVHPQSQNNLFQNNSKTFNNVSTVTNVHKRKNSGTNYESHDKRIKYSNESTGLQRRQIGCKSESTQKSNDTKSTSSNFQLITVPFETSKPKLSKQLEIKKFSTSNKPPVFTYSNEIASKQNYVTKNLDFIDKQSKKNVKDLNNSYRAKISQQNVHTPENKIVRPGLQVIPVSQNKNSHSRNSQFLQNTNNLLSSKTLAPAKTVTSGHNTKCELPKNCEISTKNVKLNASDPKLKLENTTSQKTFKQDIFNKTGCKISIPGLEVITIPSSGVKNSNYLENNNPVITKENSTSVKAIKITSNFESKHQEKSFGKPNKNIVLKEIDRKSLKIAQEGKVSEHKKVCSSPVIINVSDNDISQLKNSIKDLTDNEQPIFAHKDNSLELDSETPNKKLSLKENNDSSEDKLSQKIVNKKEVVQSKVPCLKDRGITISPVEAPNLSKKNHKNCLISTKILNIVNLDTVSLDEVLKGNDSNKRDIIPEVIVLSENEPIANDLLDCEIVNVSQDNSCHSGKNSSKTNKHITKPQYLGGLFSNDKQDPTSFHALTVESNLKEKMTSKNESDVNSSLDSANNLRSFKCSLENRRICSDSKAFADMNEASNFKNKSLLEGTELKSLAETKKITPNFDVEAGNSNTIKKLTLIIKKNRYLNLNKVRKVSKKKKVSIKPIKRKKGKATFKKKSSSSSNKTKTRGKSTKRKGAGNVISWKSIRKKSILKKVPSKESDVFSSDVIKNEIHSSNLGSFKLKSLKIILKDLKYYPIENIKYNHYQTSGYLAGSSELISEISGTNLRSAIEQSKEQKIDFMSQTNPDLIPVLSKTITLDKVINQKPTVHCDIISKCVDSMPDKSNMNFMYLDKLNEQDISLNIPCIEGQRSELFKFDELDSNSLNSNNFNLNFIDSNSNSVTSDTKTPGDNLNKSDGIHFSTSNLNSADSNPVICNTNLYKADELKDQDINLATSNENLKETSSPQYALSLNLSISDKLSVAHSANTSEEILNKTDKITIRAEDHLRVISDSLSLSITPEPIDRLANQDEPRSLADLNNLSYSPVDLEPKLSGFDELNKTYSSFLKLKKNIMNSISSPVKSQTNLEAVDSVSDITSELYNQSETLTTSIPLSKSKQCSEKFELSETSTSILLHKDSLSDSISMSVSCSPSLVAISVKHESNSVEYSELDIQSKTLDTCTSEKNNLGSMPVKSEQHCSYFKLNDTDFNTLILKENLNDSASISVTSQPNIATIESVSISKTNEENLNDTSQLDHQKINAASDLNPTPIEPEQHLAVVNELDTSDSTICTLIKDMNDSVSMSITYDSNLATLNTNEKQIKPSFVHATCLKNVNITPVVLGEHNADLSKLENCTHSNLITPRMNVSKELSEINSTFTKSLDNLEVNVLIPDINDSVSVSGVHELNIVGISQLDKQDEHQKTNTHNCNGYSPSKLEHLLDIDHSKEVHCSSLTPKDNESRLNLLFDTQEANSTVIDSVSMPVARDTNLATVDTSSPSNEQNLGDPNLWNRQSKSLTKSISDLTVLNTKNLEHVPQVDFNQMNKTNSSSLMLKKGMGGSVLKPELEEISVDFVKLSKTHSNVIMTKENISESASISIAPESHLDYKDQIDNQTKQLTINMIASDELNIFHDKEHNNQLMKGDSSIDVLENNSSYLASIYTSPKSKLERLNNLETPKTPHITSAAVTHTNDLDSVPFISKEHLPIINQSNVNNYSLSETSKSDPISVPVTLGSNLIAVNELEKQDKNLFTSIVQSNEGSESNDSWIGKAEIYNLNLVDPLPIADSCIVEKLQADKENLSEALENSNDSNSFVQQPEAKFSDKLITKISNLLLSKIEESEKNLIKESVNNYTAEQVSEDPIEERVISNCRKELKTSCAKTVEKLFDSAFPKNMTATSLNSDNELKEHFNSALSEGNVKDPYVFPIISEIQTVIVDDVIEKESNLTQPKLENENSNDSDLILPISNLTSSKENSNDLFLENSNLSQSNEHLNESSSIFDTNQVLDSIADTNNLNKINQLKNTDIVLDKFKPNVNNSDSESVISIASLVIIDDFDEHDSQFVSNEEANSFDVIPIISEVHSGISDKSNDQEFEQLLPEKNDNDFDSASLKSSEITKETQYEELKVVLPRIKLENCYSTSNTHEIIVANSNSKSESFGTNLNPVEYINDLPLPSKDFMGNFEIIMNENNTDQNENTLVDFYSGSSDQKPKINTYQGVADDILEKKLIPTQQVPQITSPKLSLKRKREHDLLKHTDVKRGLFELGTVKISKSDEESIQMNGDNHSASPNGVQNNDDVKNFINEEISVKISKSDEENTTINGNDFPPEDYLTNSSKTSNVCHKGALLHSIPLNTDNNSKSSITQFSTEEVSVESNKELFETLLDFCKEKLSSQEGKLMHHTLMKQYNRASEPYLKSRDFCYLLNSTLENIKNNPDKVWTNLKPLKVELKSYNKKSVHNQDLKCPSPALVLPKIVEIKSASLKFSDAEFNDSDSKSNCVETDKSTYLSTINAENNELSDNSAVQSAENNSIPSPAEPIKVTSLKQGFIDTLASDSSSNAGLERTSKPAFLASLGLGSLKQSEAEAKAKLDIKVQKLEKLLAQFDAKIRKLQARDMSLEDLDNEDSIYILEDRYKRKLIKTWSLLCKFKERSANLGSEMQKKFNFKGTRYPEINRVICKLVDKRKASEKQPNYSEILDTVKKANETLLIGIHESDYEYLAKEIFRDVVLELKKRRLEDFDKESGCYLTDDLKPEDDPALIDENLKKTLIVSSVEGNSKLDEVFDSFARKQETGEGNEEEDSADEDDDQNSKEGDEIVTVFTDEDESPTREKDKKKNYTNDSGKENRSHIVFESELCDTDPNLPETDPASSDSESVLCKKELSKRKGNFVINVMSDSDASTDPGENVTKKRIRPNPVPLPTEPTTQALEEDSDEFYDLPSL